MESSCLLVFTCLITWSFLVVGTHQLQSSHAQALLQAQKHLEYPKQLRIWQSRSTDFCYQSSTTQVSVSCENDVVTELRIIGDKPAKLSDFVGFAIPNQTLSGSFSMDSFITNLARLNTLRVLSLVSLGIWGPLPDKIRRLFSLEYLDLSSNFLFGSVPPKISTMLMLQALRLNDNFLNESIPDSLGSFSNLTFLSLRNNKLGGPLPSSIQQIRTLTDLVLSDNELSGNLPSLDALSNLNLLDLSGNNLESDLPSLPKGLVKAFLNSNSFSGEIPKQYGQLNMLQRLDLSFNKLTGKPPAKIFSLPYITYLNLASNALSGSLQDSINCGSELQFVDISNNRLIGGLPHCLMTKSDKLAVNYSSNCLSIGLHNQHPQSSCLEVAAKEEHSSGKNVATLAGVISGVVVVIILLALGFIVLCRRIWPRAISEQHLLHKSVQDNSASIMSSEIFTSARYVAETAKLATEGLPACRSFTIGELKEATNNFDSRFIVGEGSYGKLYKGKLENGTQVVIRCLTSSKRYTIRNLKLRLDLLSKLRHPHLVCLLGHCMDGQDDYRVNKVFLIYEYISGGNFRSQISDESSGRILSWSKRLSVLIEVAKAVHFLHTGVIPGFFSNRLKANNILFNNRGMPKLSDYGLSIISDELREETGEGHRLRQMTRLDNDVYGFGLILLETLLGPLVAAKEDKMILEELAACNGQNGLRKLISPVVLATCSQESLSTVISITNKCISSESWSPPSFEDILWNLQYAAQIQATADSEQGLHS